MAGVADERIVRGAKELAADPEFALASMAVQVLRIKAEMIREHVDSYVLPMFEGFGFDVASPGELYLTEDDERLGRWWLALDAAHRDHGYQVEAGTCPALAAEHELAMQRRERRELACRRLGIDAPCGLESCKRLDTLLDEIYEAYWCDHA